MMTPDSVRQELFIVGKELSKAATAIYEYELNAEKADLDLQLSLDKVFLSADGNIEERKAIARVQSVERSDDAIKARAVYNRAKTKAKHLELEQMRLMATLKSVQAEGA
jgi:hypothetical protein